MSWSIYSVGTPQRVIEDLNKHSQVVSGNSKEEYDKALPHLVALVGQNFGSYDSHQTPIVKFSAGGHGSGSPAQPSGPAGEDTPAMVQTLSRVYVNMEILDTKI